MLPPKLPTEPPQFAAYQRNVGPVCPRCGSPNIKRVGYTWWGGVLGPRMMNLTKCQACKYQFNGKTGADVKTPILVYNLIAFAIVGIMLIVGFLAKR